MSKSYQGKILYDADLLRGADRAGWEAAVEKNLDELWGKQSGRAVLNCLIASPREIKIVPWYDSEINATAQARNYQAATYKDRPIRSARDGHVLQGWGKGTGAGSDVRLNYTPWRFHVNLQAATLLHEMAHAAEQMAGVVFMNAMDWHFDTVAEFDAIVVENIYRSETRQDIRENHWGFGQLQGVKMIPHGPELAARLDSFRARMPDLTNALSMVDTPYNPLRWGAKGYM